MADPKLWLFLALGGFALFFIVVWAKDIIAKRRADRSTPLLPNPVDILIGFGTNFFDTLGIGSYAPTTALFRLFKVVPDERIPGTLNVGHAPPTITQAFIFIALVAVGFPTLAVLIGAAVLGAWLGAGIVARWPRRRIQIGMGAALLVAATLFVLANLGIVAAGGEALGLDGGKLVLAAAGNFMLGALMTLGIGLYGPCLIMISLLGMNPKTAFPIMMGSCAFLMPVAAARFVTADRYSLRPALGLTLAGIPAVLLAAFMVKALPLTAIRWLVVIVVSYTAITMLRSALGRADT